MAASALGVAQSRGGRIATNPDCSIPGKPDAYAVGDVAAIPDGDGFTLLDNTMVVVISELGVGWNHDGSNVPFLVAGGGAGRVNPGYYDLRAAGLQHNRLLVSMANVMGVNDLESWGTWDDSTGPVPGLLAPAS